MRFLDNRAATGSFDFQTRTPDHEFHQFRALEEPWPHGNRSRPGVINWSSRSGRFRPRKGHE
jgi:hypothetical protein